MGGHAAVGWLDRPQEQSRPDKARMRLPVAHRARDRLSRAPPLCGMLRGATAGALQRTAQCTCVSWTLEFRKSRVCRMRMMVEKPVSRAQACGTQHES